MLPAQTQDVNAPAGATGIRQSLEPSIGEWFPKSSLRKCTALAKSTTFPALGCNIKSRPHRSAGIPFWPSLDLTACCMIVQRAEDDAAHKNQMATNQIQRFRTASLSTARSAIRAVSHDRIANGTNMEPSHSTRCRCQQPLPPSPYWVQVHLIW